MTKTNEPDLVVTDLHHRTTGVSATIRTLVPYIEEQVPLALVSQRQESTRQSIGIVEALKLCRRSPGAERFRIWHVRRNNEMLWGLFCKHVLRSRIKLVMTSCALRKHSWFPRKLLAAMDAIIATSPEAARYFNEVAAIIPHGVDCDRFRPPKKEKREILKEFGLQADHAIGICGRVRPEKGADLFVDAMIELLPKHPEFVACIAGRTAPEFEQFRRNLQQKVTQAGLENRILWLGEIGYDRMPAFHAAMSVCVAPARYEGYGLVPLEAMACGVPAVCSRTGCYVDAVLPGITGELFTCGDVSGLISALRPLMSSPDYLKKLSQHCRERMEEFYSAKTEAQRIVNVYKDLWQRAA